ncbi:MAG: thioredoxin domain-containing protein [Acidobacteriota bacterium]|nr:thioredoxin domain-containing protein [Acidobacteriota bacterium]
MALFVHIASVRAVVFAQEDKKPATSQNKKSAEKAAPAAKVPTEPEELQQTINDAGNDRAALVRNLEAVLQKYPEAPQRPQIFRALVEATLQLRDTGRAAQYAERLISLTPDDVSIMLVAIQLLQRNGDEAGLRRATSYATRVLAFVDRTAMNAKSPKVSPEEWQTEKARDRSSVLLLRGQLYLKLKESADAQKDFADSYKALPAAGAAEKLGEVAELNKDSATAIEQYARAFALADEANSGVTRHEIRQKLGNAWRLARGSDDGLGDYLLRQYDQVTRDNAQTASGSKAAKNANAHEISEFTLRKAPGREPFPLADTKGRVVVINFWATWCGPCRAIEPKFEHVETQFQGNHDISFLAANCDEDESLVAPYVEEAKPRGQIVFADGLDRLLAVNSFPTVVVVDRSGKIVYRAEGFDDESFERDLVAAVRHTLDANKAAEPKVNSSR